MAFPKMRRLIYLIITLYAACLTAFSHNDTTLIYRIRVDQDINNSTVRLISVGLKNAESAKADYVLLDLDTYGGAVDAADSIRTALLKSRIPIAAYVNLQAASAGALISIACDSIYMNTGATIGAATVVDQTGKEAPDKYQSFMRAMMRSTAQAQGRDPLIAESMVDTANVLSLTPEEAVEVGYCEGIYESLEEVALAIAAGKSFEIKSLDDDLTWLDKLTQILMNPLLQSIFMMMIVGGIFVEIRTPGIGLPLVTAIVGAMLYFFPLYIESLAASWEILIFFIGLLLIAAEIFVIPGFGISGISGIIAVIFALTFSMIDNVEMFRWDGSLDLTPVIKPLGLVVASTTVAVFGSVLLVRKLYDTRSFDHIALRNSLDSKDGFVGVASGLDSIVGETVSVHTDLKPSGKIIAADGRIYEAVLAFGGFADKGEKVKVLRAEQGRLYCDKL